MKSYIKKSFNVSPRQNVNKLEFICSHHNYNNALQVAIYVHMKNVLKPQRSPYVNKNGHAPHVYTYMA